jgi:D-alanyl-D-alanine carboxypeptidase/D-alanyl-D-alanine-endopeptidase (penicillin-binding protein 4)
MVRRASRLLAGFALLALAGWAAAQSASPATAAPAAPVAPSAPGAPGTSAVPAETDAAPLPASLPPALAQALRAARLPAGGVGIMVQDVASGRTLAALNPERAMNPASVMKLVTTYAALEMLGPSYIWRTGLFEAGARRGDVLEGDLVMRGSGDPKLTQEQLWLALKALRARGLREIRGNVLTDRGAFEISGYDASRFDGDPLRAYNAGPDALLINFKSLAITFAPDESSGQVAVSIEPKLAGIPLRSAVKAVNGPCADFRSYAVRPKIDATGVSLTGTYSTACGSRTWWLHPYELTAVQYAGAVFKALWAGVGGTITGEVRDAPLPAGARLVYEIESPTLAEVVRDINKFSNNVMARQLFLTLSIDGRTPGSAERSARAVRTWMAERRLGGEELVMENGSGLSRLERVSPATLSRLLLAAWRSPVMPEFMASMPLVAYDGTMRRRMKTRDVAGQAHIKTGSLNDVRSIAGYVLAASGRRLAVVCVVNAGNLAGAQGLQDALLQWAYSEG